MAESSDSPPSPSSPLPINADTSDADGPLANADHLTRPEVVVRRLRLLKQLIRVYRNHHWALMEQLRKLHRDYYWDYGKSPFKEDESLGNCTNGVGENGKLGFRLAGNGGDDIRRCQVSQCKVKAMALTKFCPVHILSDPHQKLYKGCTFVTKSSQSGPQFCNKPVLRSTVPTLCPTHYQKGEKNLIRDLKKAGLNVSSLDNVCPKFHVLIAEYVSQIKTKRRATQKTSVVKVEPK
ncbi:hypothetical protein UlMin_012562 [Ulmus minor]